MSSAAKTGLRRALLVLLVLLAAHVDAARAQQPVTVQAEITKQGASDQGAVADASNVVVWLTPVDRSSSNVSAPPAGRVPQMVQRNKTFEPRILVVQVGTVVQFPNKDPFLHNVFSLFNGKRFDLGFYESGSAKSVRFDRQGVSFLFCSIHEDMSAAVIAVDTPYFGLSDRNGHISIPNVPDGRYEMHVWYERGLPDDLKSLDRSVEISASTRSLQHIRVVENPDFTLAHKNKFGQDYVPPAGGGYTVP